MPVPRRGPGGRAGGRSRSLCHKLPAARGRHGALVRRAGPTRWRWAGRRQPRCAPGGGGPVSLPWPRCHPSRVLIGARRLFAGSSVGRAGLGRDGPVPPPPIIEPSGPRIRASQTCDVRPPFTFNSGVSIRYAQGSSKPMNDPNGSQNKATRVQSYESRGKVEPRITGWRPLTC